MITKQYGYYDIMEIHHFHPSPSLKYPENNETKTIISCQELSLHFFISLAQTLENLNKYAHLINPQNVTETLVKHDSEHTELTPELF